jgi:hypothetical protein
MWGIFDKLDAWFIDGWRRWWKMLSLWYTGITAALAVVVQLGPILPPQLKEAIPQPWGTIITIAWFLVWVVMRLKAQKLAGA